MAKYANEGLKKIIVSVAGMQGLAETMLELPYEELVAVGGEILAIKECAERILVACEHGLDKDQVKGLMRYANNHTLEVVSKYSPRSGRDYYTVSQEAMDRLLLDVVSSCAFCIKEGKELKRCQRRKDLLECGIIGSTSGDCPYKDGG